MEKQLDVIDYPTTKKVKIIKFYLIGPAKMWWWRVKNTLVIVTWEEFLVALKRKKENEFLLLKQNTMSVLEYTSKFKELSRFVKEIVNIVNVPGTLGA